MFEEGKVWTQLLLFRCFPVSCLCILPLRVETTCFNMKVLRLLINVGCTLHPLGLWTERNNRSHLRMEQALKPPRERQNFRVPNSSNYQLCDLGQVFYVLQFPHCTKGVRLELMVPFSKRCMTVILIFFKCSQQGLTHTCLVNVRCYYLHGKCTLASYTSRNSYTWLIFKDAQNFRGDQLHRNTVTKIQKKNLQYSNICASLLNPLNTEISQQV